MRRLFLCLAAIAAANAYYLGIQELMMKGARITSGEISCDNVQYLHIGDKTDLKFDCFVTPTTDDPPKPDAVKLVYTSDPIGTNSQNIQGTIILSDTSNITFSFKPDMKTGVQHNSPVTANYNPLANPPDPATTTTSAPLPPDCTPNTGADRDKPECKCQDWQMAGKAPCDEFCKTADTAAFAACSCAIAPENYDKEYCKCTAVNTPPKCNCNANAAFCSGPAPAQAAILLGHPLDCAGADKDKQECKCQIGANAAQCTDFCRTADVAKYSACSCALYSNFKEDYCKCTAENTPKNCRAETSLAVASAMCQKATMAGKHPCISFCQDPKNANYAACTPSNVAMNNIKAVRKTVPRLRPIDATVSATVNVDDLPAPVRLRGPGPVHPPTVEEGEEVRRVKRDASNDVQITVYYYVLDEPGNPAAVWAAVIEGIILLLFVGACFWFFFWAPRSRAAQTAGAAAADPYKDTPNYSVSYANSGYNQRIDAFQNPPAPVATPAAAPARPATTDYLDAWATDNVPRNATPASAINASTFEPRHQRVDSSGLVTVNLS